MADVVDDTYLDMISNAFQFLEDDYGFKLTRINSIMTAYENNNFCIRVNYYERSGYVEFSVLEKHLDEKVFLEDLCQAFGGALEPFERGLAAYDLGVLERCIDRLAESIKSELRDFLSGDKVAILKAVAVHNRQHEELLDDMELGGTRMSASEAWDRQDLSKFLESMYRIPSEKRTESEKRRVRIAEIKIGHQDDS